MSGFCDCPLDAMGLSAHWTTCIYGPVSPAPALPATVPKTIKAGQVTYTVSVDPAEWEEMAHAESSSRGAMGRTDSNRSRIFINPHMAPDVQRLTLAHEAIHALIFGAMGDADFDKLGDSGGERQETVVAMFEAPLLGLIRDNPDLIAYLTASA